MQPEKFPHILLRDITQKQSYTPKTGGGSSEDALQEKDPDVHGEFLKLAYDSALKKYRDLCRQNGITDERRLDEGFTVEVKAPENVGLEYTKLEDRRGREHLEVLNVKVDESGNVSSAVIYVPPKKKENLSKKIEAYRDESKKTEEGHRENQKLLDTVEDIVAAELGAFWTDTLPFPSAGDARNWELWLRDGTIDRVRKVLSSQVWGAVMSEHYLQFPDRQICTVRSDLATLQKLSLMTNALTSFRYNRTQSDFFASMTPREQARWQEELAGRVDYDMRNSGVCVLDTGLYDEHRLLKPAIRLGTVDSYDPDWKKHDHDGHGTEMAGLALFGDLVPILENSQRVDIRHYLESVKVFPPEGRNENEHVGAVTEESVYRAETNHAGLDRVFCISWTVSPEAADGQHPAALKGRPTALSAKVDQMSFGTETARNWRVEDARKRLFSISAGNIQEKLRHGEYPTKNDLSEVEEPAQSWNALTVGAFTSKVWVDDPSYEGWEPVAGPDELSPRSRTSVIWGKLPWPVKPDIVLEGGNYIGKGDFPPEDHADLSVLTTGKDTPFSQSCDTSAANAQACRLGAMIWAEYPDYWPETVRGLLVHSALWTPAMFEQWVNPANANTAQKITLLRRYGYGVPDAEIMLSSLKNRPCVIIQDSLKPFKIGADEEGNPRSYASYCEMNFYELPWPKEQLEELFGETVKLRVSLSYFIEPNPSERPPKTRYYYASHGLRFKMKRPGESPSQFLERINAQLAESEARAEDTEDVSNVGQDKWLLGPKTRDRGSLISDVWTGTGAELANQNMLAVVPQGGWWKHRLRFPDENKPRHTEKVRFSLIVSLESEADVDIYTPIIQKTDLIGQAVV